VADAQELRAAGFRQSFFRGAKVTDLILEKMPVTISLGLWATLITYLVSIPLGIRKAVHHGSHFDVWSSTAIIIGYAMPAFLFAMLLIVVFAGGTSLNWFPVRGLVSDNFDAVDPGQGRRLLLAPGAAGHRAGDRRIRHPDHPDQELVPQRNHPPVRGHRPRQGPERAPRAVRPRVPQRHAAGGRRDSAGVDQVFSPARC
jgi:hypothetical protein